MNKKNKYMCLVLFIKLMIYCVIGSYKSYGIEILERYIFGLKWYMYNILMF